MRTAATPITATVIHPSASIALLAVKGPITDFFAASSRITTTSGTATTPLITALQKSAFIGLSGEYCRTRPSRTLVAITP
jgi:hypothetical protein